LKKYPQGLKIKAEDQRMTDSRTNQVLESLKASPFRSRFRLNQKDLLYVRDKGLETIRRHAFDFITSRIADPFPKNDGKQTPMRGHPAFIAQHATATCCRNCLQKWHGIKKGRQLTNKEIEYIVEAIMTWIEGQTEKDLKF